MQISMQTIPRSVFHKLKNTKTVTERNKYRIQPCRSPRNHPATIAADQQRKVFCSRNVWQHQTLGIFFRISQSGYPILDQQAHLADRIYPWHYIPPSDDHSDRDRASLEDSSAYETPVDWV